ncbi:ABC transporter permease [Devosia insulae DS-56]|uniref:Autoinducer 2 import system permease protein LsrD n=1 Tax=Devosia insulae DS-56 TaxID=1116389 RepID=A0A1E5XWP5_9HYPH|nr:ABC transporter permease [Devosia insulae]OEO33005.1 ABC transporter permease [Devosia insulae DS-56]RYE43497.1 MAG: ABC transporter permease [Hyphomicrobiales bacterium]
MNPNTRRALEFVLDNLVWFMLLFVLLVFSIFVPNYFQPGIFANIIEASSVLGVMSIGLALVIIAGHMDLSVESVAALSAMAVGIVFCSAGIGMGVQLTPDWLGVPVSLLIALAVGSAIGAFNGLLIVKLKMNAFIVTLASYIWVRGVVLALSGGRSAQDLAPAIRWFGVQRLLGLPLTAWIAILCFVVFSLIMAKSRFGRHLIIIGGNQNAAFRAGIKVDRILITSFVLAGAIAALAGWLLAIRTSGATANLGMGLLFNAFAAVVIGGVSLKGGVGALPGVYAGVLLLSAINTAINLMGLPATSTQVIHGLLVLAAVLLDTLKLSIRQKLA